MFSRATAVPLHVGKSTLRIAAGMVATLCFLLPGSKLDAQQAGAQTAAPVVENARRQDRSSCRVA